MNTKKAGRAFKKIIAAIIAMIIVVSSFPAVYAYEKSEITSWNDGVNIVRENSVINADISKDVIVIIADTVDSITFEGEIAVDGMIYFVDKNCSFLPETQSSKIVFNDKSAMVAEDSALIGPEEIDLSVIKAIEELSEKTDSIPETIAPVVSMSEDAVYAIGGKWNDENDICEESIISFLSGTFLVTDDKLLNIDEIPRIIIGKDVSFAFQGSISGNKSYTLYNKSTDSTTIKSLSKIAKENSKVAVYHYVSSVIGAESESKYYKADEIFEITASEDKYIKKISLEGKEIEIEDDSTYILKITRPYNIEVALDDRVYSVTVNASDNGTVSEYQNTVKYNNSWIVSLIADNGYYTDVSVVDEKGNDISYSFDDGELKVDSVKTNIVVNVSFEETLAEEIKVTCNNTKFYPNGRYQFDADVLPSDTFNKNVIWSVEDEKGDLVKENIAKIDKTGLLEISNNAEDGTSFFVVAVSEKMNDISRKYAVEISLDSADNINDYLNFNGKEFDPDKWYKDDVKISLMSELVDQGYRFAYTDEGEIPPISDASTSVEIKQSTDNIKFRLIKGNQENADEFSVLDIIGSYRVRIDKDKPIIDEIKVDYNSLIENEKWGMTAKVTVKVTDTNSGIDSVEYRKTSESTSVEAKNVEKKNDDTFIYTIELDQDTGSGENYVFIVSDNAGNKAEKEITISIDNTPAKVDVKFKKNDITEWIDVVTFGILNINSKSRFVIEPSDRGSGINSVKYAFTSNGTIPNDSQWKLYNEKDEIKISNKEDKFLFVQVIDNVGNVTNYNYGVGKEISLDDDPPTWSVSVNSEPLSDSNKTIYISSDDDDFIIEASTEDTERNATGVEGVKAELFFGGTSIGIYGNSNYTSDKFSFSKSTIINAIYNQMGEAVFEDGNYEIEFVSSDNAGNFSDKITVCIIKDTVKPKVIINDNPVVPVKSAELTLDFEKGCSDISKVFVIKPDGTEEEVVPVDGKYTYSAVNGVYEFYAVNAVGVCGEKSSVSVTMVDTLKPVVTLEAKINGKDYDCDWTNSKEPVIISLFTEGSLGTSEFFYREKGEEVWNQIEGDTFTVANDCDKVYEFKANSASGVIGDKTEEIVIKRDATPAKVESVSYTNSPIKAFIDSITFGLFFNDKADLLINVSDKLSGAKSVKLLAVTNSGEIVYSKTVEVEKDKAEFTVPAQFRGIFKIELTDIAGNCAEAEKEASIKGIIDAEGASDYQIIIDSIAPVISFSDNIEDKGIYSGSPELGIEITEANFFDDCVNISIEGKDINGKNILCPDTSNIEWNLSGSDTYKTVIPFENDGDYTVIVKATDKSENTDEKTISFNVDNSAPKISIEYLDGNKPSNTYDGIPYYNSARKAKITILERNFVWNDSDLAIKAEDIDGNEIACEKYSQADWKSNNNEHTLIVAFDVDAKYSFEVKNTDKLNNASNPTDKDVFVVDTTEANIVSISYSEPIIKELINNISFNIFRAFFKDEINVTVKTTDLTSGIKSIDFSAELGEDVSDINKSIERKVEYDVPEKTQEKTFIIPAQFRGKISVKVTNFAEEKTAATANDILSSFNIEKLPDNYEIIADNIPPEINPLTLNGSTKDGLFYTGTPELNVEIKEANFFGEDVLFEIKSVDDDGGNGNIPDVSSLKWSYKGNDIYSTSIPFKDDGDYTVTVNCHDRSGNVAERSQTVSFTVDNKAPVVSVKYEGSAPANSEDGIEYYTSARTATVEIIEHNYRWTENDIIITAEDVNGNPVETPDIDISEEKWTHTGNTHTLTILYVADAEYRFDVTNTDCAGNPASKHDTEMFVVDKTDPIIDNIQYNNPVWKNFINNITFGVFFKDSIDVIINVSDEISGIKKIDISADLSENVSSINNSFADSKEFKTRNESQSVTFTIPAQFRGNINVTVTNFATRTTGSIDSDILKSFNIEKTYDDYEFIADNKAPVITFSSNIEEGKFYQGKPELTVTVNEANFFEEDVIIDIKSVDDNGKAGTVPDLSAIRWIPAGDDTYMKVIPFEADGDYTVVADYTDKSGNEAEQKKVSFTVDNTLPTITVTYDNDEIKNAQNGINYYTNSRTATVLIIEHNYQWNENDVIITAKDVNGEEITVPNVSKSAWTHNGNEHTLIIEYDTDAIYTFDVKNTDLAGNISTERDTENFAIDTVDPELKSEDIVFSKVNPVGTVDEQNINSYKTYKFFCNGETSVTITAFDSTSGIKDINVYIYDDDKQEKTDINGFKQDMPTESATFKFNLPENFKGYVYAQAVDFSTRTSKGEAEDNYTKSNGAIVETLNKHTETFFGEIVAKDEPNKNGFYNADLRIVLNLKDPYSGINNLSYKVGSSDKVVMDFTDENDVIYDWTSGEMVINAARNNNNHVEVVMSYVDNAGNPHEERQVFNVEYKIDITKPEIFVQYDNNSADNSLFFKANRVATITVDELNFDAKDVVYTIKKDGQPYNAILPAESSWKHNGERHTVNLVYSTDGYYTFDVAYKDLADNKNEGVNYINSISTNKFVVDKTKPIISSVIYNNNSATNANYYKQARNAKITIVDHNFDPERSLVALKSVDDGKVIASPKVSEWQTEGKDVFSSMVKFNDDALHGIDISCTDLAGNTADKYPHDEFYIDNTDPVVEIKGVVNKSANKNVIAPIITVSDKNIDYSSIKIELIGVNNGKMKIFGTEKITKNGYTFIFDDFERIKKMDDIYTLTVTATDLAGRTNKNIKVYSNGGEPILLGTNNITFSVNRFGSVYKISEDTEKINGKTISKEHDIIIEEINADALKDFRVIIRKNTQKIELVEGKDFRVEISGGDGSWFTYKYIIFKENFKDEGFYSVELFSTDAAGNISENTLDTKTKEISFNIDKNPPVVNVTNVKKGETKIAPSFDAVVYISDNIRLSKVNIKLDGKNVQYVNKEDEYVITIKAATTLSEAKHSLEVVASDEVGNETPVTISPFYVTTSKLVAFLTNRPLVIGSSSGLLAVISGFIFIILFKRKKKDEEQDQF